MTVPRRFGIIRFVGNLIKVLAWLFLIFMILIAVSAFLFGDRLDQLIPAAGAGQDALNGYLTMFNDIGGKYVIAALVLFYGIIGFLWLFVAGESMLLYLAMEENTRLTAALLLRMHQESQPEPQTRGGGYGSYGGGFDN